MSLENSTAHAILPPPDPPGPMKWVRDNFFGTWLNTFLSIISISLLYVLVRGGSQWLLQADWTPVTQSPMLYLVGQYPREEIWRVGVGLIWVMFFLGVSWGKWGGLLRGIGIGAIVFFTFFVLLPVQHDQLDTSMRIFLAINILVIVAGYFIGRMPMIKAAWIGIAWLLTPVVFTVLLAGFKGNEFMPSVSTTFWGGVLVTFVLAFGGIILSFPIGVALALGRRSELPMVRIISTVFIETIRGVPLITILFMFSIILALFLPEGSRIDRLLRALMAVTVFSSAYMAENIRGGLQAIPPGQIEAAEALGMSNFQTMTFIVLPQAIRAVIPAIINQFIGLFKDTTLVVIVGINDLLGIGKAILNGTPEFLLLNAEVYLFISLIYWVFSYLLSAAGSRLETAMGVGSR